MQTFAISTVEWNEQIQVYHQAHHILLATIKVDTIVMIVSALCQRLQTHKSEQEKETVFSV